MSYRHVGLTNLQYRKSALIEFRGVDYSSQRFKVSPSRAIDELNFIYKDGMAQKRQGSTIFGLAPIFSIVSKNEKDNRGEPISFTNGISINSLWKFKDSWGDEHIIAHVGKILCEVYIKDEKATFKPIGENTGVVNEYECFTFDDFISMNSGFVGADKFWFFGGTKFVVLEYDTSSEGTIHAVDDWRGTYVPTTTIGITEKDSGIGLRAHLDDVNIMSRWRINEIVGGTEGKKDIYTYILDAGMWPYSSNDTNEVTIKIEASGYNFVSDVEPVFSEDSYEPYPVGARGFSVFLSSDIHSARKEEFTIPAGGRTSVSALCGEGGSFDIEYGYTMIDDKGHLTRATKVIGLDEILSDPSKYGFQVFYDDYDQDDMTLEEASSESGSRHRLHIAYFIYDRDNDKVYKSVLSYTVFVDGETTEKQTNFSLKLSPIPGKTTIIDGNSGAVTFVVEGTMSYMVVKDDFSKQIGETLTLTSKYDSLGNKRLFDEDGDEYFGYLSVALDDDYDPIRTELNMFNDWGNSAGTTSIWVKYPVFDNISHDLINNCHFGHLFGNTNAKNRLFVSGNPYHKNCDWHSGEINESKISDFGMTNGNFSYFPDTSYCFYGQTDNEIVGYDIISDSKMVVLKSKSDKEPTIYYRTSNLSLVRSDTGEVQTITQGNLYKEEYPLLVGNISKGALSNHMMCNFNGDTLFVTDEKEINGLDITETLADTQRYSHSRSKYINNRIKNEITEDSVLWNDGKYLFLANEECMYISHFEEFDTETRQYDWWKQSIKSAISFLKIGNGIYFGTREGKLCVLENGSYEDKIDTYARLFCQREDSSTIMINDELVSLFSKGDKIAVKIPKQINHKLYEFARKEVEFKYNDADDCLEFPIGIGEIVSSIIYSNEEMFVETSGIDEIKPSKYEILDSSLGTYHKGIRIRFANINNSSIERIALELEGTFSAEYSEERRGITLKDKKGLEVNVIYSFGGIDTDTIVKDCKIFSYTPVKAFYISAPMTMGDLMRNKTFWSWTIVNDTDESGEVEICQATNEKDLDGMMGIVAFKGEKGYGFDLDDLSYFDTSFSRFTIPYKYTYSYPLSAPFLCLGFKNYEKTNCVLSSVQVLYTLSGNSFGNY